MCGIPRHHAVVEIQVSYVSITGFCRIFLIVTCDDMDSKYFEVFAVYKSRPIVNVGYMYTHSMHGTTVHVGIYNCRSHLPIILSVFISAYINPIVSHYTVCTYADKRLWESWWTASRTSGKSLHELYDRWNMHTELHVELQLGATLFPCRT